MAIHKVLVWDGSSYRKAIGKVMTIDGLKDFFRPIDFSTNFTSFEKMVLQNTKTYIKEPIVAGQKTLLLQNSIGFNEGQEVTLTSGTSSESAKIVGRNLIDTSMLVANDATAIISEYVSKGIIKISDIGGYGGVRIDARKLKPNTQYVMSYKYKKTAGSLNRIAGHTDPTWGNNTTFIDGQEVGKYSTVGSGVVPDDGNIHEVTIFITTPSNVNPSDRIDIQPNRASFTSVSIDVYDWKLEEGNNITPWTPSPEDVYGTDLNVISITPTINSYPINSILGRSIEGERKTYSISIS
jgi:hypothetical protein